MFDKKISLKIFHKKKIVEKKIFHFDLKKDQKNQKKFFKNFIKSK